MKKFEKMLALALTVVPCLGLAGECEGDLNGSSSTCIGNPLLMSSLPWIPAQTSIVGDNNLVTGTYVGSIGGCPGIESCGVIGQNRVGFRVIDIDVEFTVEERWSRLEFVVDKNYFAQSDAKVAQFFSVEFTDTTGDLVDEIALSAEISDATGDLVITAVDAVAGGPSVSASMSLQGDAAFRIGMLGEGSSHTPIFYIMIGDRSISDTHEIVFLTTNILPADERQGAAGNGTIVDASAVRPTKIQYGNMGTTWDAVSMFKGDNGNRSILYLKELRLDIGEAGVPYIDPPTGS